MSGVSADGWAWTCALCGASHALTPGDALRLGPIQAWPELDPAGGDFMDAGGDPAGPTLPAPPALAAGLVVDACGTTATAGGRAEVRRLSIFL